MAGHHSKKTNTRFADIAAAAAAAKKTLVDPEALFFRVTRDDIDRYDVAALAATAILAEQEIRAWNGETARVSLTTSDELVQDGAAVSVLAITTANKPFLYDSVMGEVTTHVRDIHLTLHPILVVNGKQPVRLFDHGESQETDRRVSHIQIHMPKLSESAGQALKSRVDHVLSQVRAAVGDWNAMLSMLDAAAADITALPSGGRKAARTEALDFLAWLRDNNFTFLGMREYVYTETDGVGELNRAGSAGLGILSDPDVRVLRQGAAQVTTTPEILNFLQGPDYLIVTKANVRSVVHRRAYMDYIGIKRFDAQGKVTGELRVVGLFTSTAYTRSVTRIPLLRSKVQAVVDNFGYDPESHSGKLLLNTLESYPRDDLFQIDATLLTRFCTQINDLTDRPRVRVLPRIDRFDRFVSVIVYVPRDQYDSIARERIGAYLKLVYDGRVSAFYPAFPEGGVARVHFIIGRSGGPTPKVTQEQLERDVRALVARWEDQFRALGGDQALSQLRFPSRPEGGFGADLMEP